MTALVCHAHIVSRVLCILHPKSDWSSEDWDGTKAKAREQNNSLIDFNDPKPQTNVEQTTDIDQVTFCNLQIGQRDLKEELIEVMTSLIPPPQVTETPGEVPENTNGEELLKQRRGFTRKKKNMYYMTEYIWDNLAKRKRVIQTQMAQLIPISDEDTSIHKL